MARRAKRKTKKRAPAAGNGIDYGLMDGFVGHLTRVVQVRLFQFYFERLDHIGVTPGAFAVLTILRTNPGIPHGALSEFIAAHGPNVTNLVDRLVRVGWVERRKLSGDRRTTGHYLTARGQAKSDAILKTGLAHDKHATSALSATERATLLRLLAKLDRALASRVRPLD